MLELAPDHKRATANKKRFQRLINETKTEEEKRNNNRSDNKVVQVRNSIQSKSNDLQSKSNDLQSNRPETQRTGRKKTEKEVYKSLCRGEKHLSARQEAELKCYFWNTSGPYFRYTRIKVEEISSSNSTLFRTVKSKYSNH